MSDSISNRGAGVFDGTTIFAHHLLHLASPRGGVTNLFARQMLVLRFLMHSQHNQVITLESADWAHTDTN